MCSDGSDKSFKTIQFTSKLLDRAKGDELVVICVENTKVDGAAVNQAVTHYLETEGVSKTKL